MYVLKVRFSHKEHLLEGVTLVLPEQQATLIILHVSPVLVSDNLCD